MFTIKKKYVRCARGTRRSKKTKTCRSINKKRCRRGSHRNRNNGKCEKV
jgi:hypothetical protein